MRMMGAPHLSKYVACHGNVHCRRIMEYTPFSDKPQSQKLAAREQTAQFEVISCRTTPGNVK